MTLPILQVSSHKLVEDEIRLLCTVCLRAGIHTAVVDDPSQPPLMFVQPPNADRRERIATALLAGILANPNTSSEPSWASGRALRLADDFIRQLDARA